MNDEVPDGYAMPLRTSLTRPILLGGVPRAFAILNATIGAAIGFGLQQPFIGFPLWAVLQGAALGGDAALFDALQAALLASDDRNERHDLLAALGHFRAPALADRARALLLNPALDIRESRGPLMRAQARDTVTRAGLLGFVRFRVG